MSLTPVKGLVLAGALALAGCLEVPRQTLLSNEFQPAEHCLYPSLPAIAPLPAQFSLLSWNIYKQQRNWQPELSRWMADTDVLLLQEASGRDDFYQWLEQQQLHWFQADAFEWQQLPNGVLTASRQPAVQVCAERMTEPATRIPKSLLFSRYSLAGAKEQLLVVNLHAVNFSLRGRTYQAQLDMISRAIAGHSGPLIVAGDFNRWNARRQQQLNQWAVTHQLSEAVPAPDLRTRFWDYPLDAIFYRGLTLITAHSINTHASDHTPIKASFSTL